MEKPIIIEKDIYQLLQEVRYELSLMDLKKSGYNAFGKFNYPELNDFVPVATKLFYQKGITPIFYISVDGDGVEYAYMDLHKGMEMIQFKIPTAEPGMANPIQSQGGKVTYMRRYVYQCVLDLCIPDMIDRQETIKSNLITKDQWALLNTLYTKDEVKAFYKDLGISNGKQIPFD